MYTLKFPIPTRNEKPFISPLTSIHLPLSTMPYRLIYKLPNMFTLFIIFHYFIHGTVLVPRLSVRKFMGSIQKKLPAPKVSHKNFCYERVFKGILL